MYLTRMALDIKKPESVKALVSPNLIHGAVEHAFSGDRTRNLWRIDQLGGQRYLLILSEGVPDLSRAVVQFGDEQRLPETKDYAPLLDRIQTGGKWHFRLVANPAVTKTDEERHRVLSHVTVAYQKKWLLDRAEKNGFSLSDADFDVVWRNRYNFRKSDRNRVQFTAVAFEGVLTVSERERFKAALSKGIGRERAYGMGMITVVGVFK